MPLAFDSLSHGRIAFGFFNIESDMLLLEHYFFFSTDFCRYINEAATVKDAGDFNRNWKVTDITDRMAIGDLMGAIHGVRYLGFIGEVYRRFPFPKAPEAFRQNPEGVFTRPVMEEIISPYGRKASIPFRIDLEGNSVTIGEYVFDRSGFHALLRYVWQGGYPRWRNDEPPDYVLQMKRLAETAMHPVFNGIRF